MARHSHTDPAAKPAADQRRDDPHGLGDHLEDASGEAKSLPHSHRETTETAPLKKDEPKTDAP